MCLRRGKGGDSDDGGCFSGPKKKDKKKNPQVKMCVK
jgi:hypothetical protein